MCRSPSAPPAPAARSRPAAPSPQLPPCLPELGARLGAAGARLRSPSRPRSGPLPAPRRSPLPRCCSCRCCRRDGYTGRCDDLMAPGSPSVGRISRCADVTMLPSRERSTAESCNNWLQFRVIIGEEHVSYTEAAAAAAHGGPGRASPLAPTAQHPTQGSLGLHSAVPIEVQRQGLTPLPAKWSPRASSHPLQKSLMV